jgi:hypothetical protein
MADPLLRPPRTDPWRLLTAEELERCSLLQQARYHEIAALHAFDGYRPLGALLKKHDDDWVRRDQLTKHHLAEAKRLRLQSPKVTGR